jgi:hypothetical protein
MESYALVVQGGIFNAVQVSLVVVLTGDPVLDTPLIVTITDDLGSNIGGTVTINPGESYGTTTFSGTVAGIHTLTATHTGGNGTIVDPDPIAITTVAIPTGIEPSVPKTEEEILADLYIVRDNLVAQKLKLTLKPKPTYEIDGQRVEWTQYLQYLDKALIGIREAILIYEGPYEEETVGFTP